jgi:hypothetical protein
MSAILKQAPAGVAGDITRVDDSQVEPAVLVGLSGVYPTNFGVPMKYVAGGIAQFAAGDAATVFAGTLVREVPSMSATVAADSSYESVAPNPLFPAALMVKGYMSVKCTVGTPVRGGIVYVCNNTAGGAIGDFQATTSANNVALTNASWASDGKDSFNNAEIRVAMVK